MQSLGQRLKAVRGHLSQATMAAKLGIPQQTWNNYETGRSNPSFGLLDVVCTEFSINAEWLLFGRGQMRLSEPPPMPPGACFSADIVYDVVETLEEYLQGQELEMEPSAKAEVVRQLCQMVVEHEAGEVRPGQMLRLIKGALKAG